MRALPRSGSHGSDHSHIDRIPHPPFPDRGKFPVPSRSDIYEEDDALLPGAHSH